ncbi:MYND-type domain-containing protein [Favolaschia claudopus]|uniref:MYND-type domain-containing protein n=1 Tax=Favolaschia claudopus TaxID=2862362 RepID=A0AAW0AAZ1_9AGAR
MQAYYALPAAGNYHTAPHALRQRGYRLCDQCGAAENPSVSRFRLCGGCMTTQYCSPTCQKIHWPSHKAICTHTMDQVAVAKQQVQQQLAPTDPTANLAKNLRKFTSAYASLLGWAGFQALQLKRIPSNIRQNALLIELDPVPHPESHRRFTIAATHIVPRTYICDPLVIADIQRREERCRANGGIGTAVILIQCGTVSQVMPVEVDPPAKISWDVREDWEDVLCHYVDNGKLEFKPRSTTQRGVYYG